MRLIILLCVCSLKFFAQETYSVSIRILFGQEKLQQEKMYSLQGGTVSIEACRFYVSHFCFLKGKDTVWKEPNSVHLTDAFKGETQKLLFKTSRKFDFDRISFQLGIDSTTNVSGAMGGDLDPTTGMYWSWQSGYINFKAEGKSSLCVNADKTFQFHLGGYASPFTSLQNIILKVSAKNILAINFDMETFLTKTGLSRQNHIMSPSQKAVELSKFVASCFYVHEE